MPMGRAALHSLAECLSWHAQQCKTPQQRGMTGPRTSLTPMTNMGASLEGALMMTFLAPPLRCLLACTCGLYSTEMQVCARSKWRPSTGDMQLPGFALQLAGCLRPELRQSMFQGLQPSLAVLLAGRAKLGGLQGCCTCSDPQDSPRLCL